MLLGLRLIAPLALIDDILLEERVGAVDEEPPPPPQFRSDAHSVRWFMPKGAVPTDLLVMVLLRQAGFWCICGQQSVLGRDVSPVTLVSDGKPREIRHLRFAACRSSVRQRVFSGPKSPDAPEPYHVQLHQLIEHSAVVPSAEIAPE
jgi:hypothetical protein